MILVTIAGKTFELELDNLALIDSEFIIQIDGQSVSVKLPDPNPGNDEIGWLIIDGQPYEVSLDRDFRWIETKAGYLSLDVRDKELFHPQPRPGDGRIKAPIPGLVTKIMVIEGEEVNTGQPLLVLEAMKMENEIRTQHTGRIKSIHVSTGQSVSLHELLVEIV